MPTIQDLIRARDNNNQNQGQGITPEQADILQNGRPEPFGEEGNYDLDFRGDPLRAIEQIIEAQFGWIEDRDQLSQEFRNEAEKLLNDSPEYVRPAIIDRLIGRLENISKETRSLYEDAGSQARQDLREGIRDGLKAYTESARNAVNAVKTGAEDSVESYQSALEAVDTGFDEALNTLGTSTADALSTIRKGGQRVVDLVSERTGQYLEQAGISASKIRKEGQRGAEDIRRMSDQAVQSFEDDRGDILDIYKKGYDDYVTESQEAVDSLLGDSNDMLNFYQERASRLEMPGQSILEAKIGSQTQSNVRQLKEIGGGSANTLNAIANTLSQQQSQMRMMAAEAAQYKAAREAELGEVMGMATQMGYNARQRAAEGRNTAANTYARGAESLATTGASLQDRRAGRYGEAARLAADSEAMSGRMELDANRYATGQMTDAEAYRTDSLAGMQYKTGVAMSDMESRRGIARADARQALGRGQMQAGLAVGDVEHRTGAGMADRMMKSGEMLSRGELDIADTMSRGYAQSMKYESAAAGLDADATDREWMRNQYQPYENRLRYNMDQANRTDPFAYKMDTAGDAAGINWGMFGLRQQQDAADKDRKFNFWTGLLGSIISGGSKVGSAAIMGG